MSFPYPQDRNRDRREKGEQPYKDEREALRQSEVSLQAEAEAYGEARLQESEEETRERLQAEVAERMREIGADREQS